MSLKRKIYFGVIILILVLNVALHFPAEWHELHDPVNHPTGLTFLFYLAWNVFAASMEFFISPLGIFVMVGLVLGHAATRDLKPSTDTQTKVSNDTDARI
jgi:hypothetical protein